MLLLESLLGLDKSFFKENSFVSILNTSFHFRITKPSIKVNVLNHHLICVEPDLAKIQSRGYIFCKSD